MAARKRAGLARGKTWRVPHRLGIARKAAAPTHQQIAGMLIAKGGAARWHLSSGCMATSLRNMLAISVSVTIISYQR